MLNLMLLKNVSKFTMFKDVQKKSKLNFLFPKEGFKYGKGIEAQILKFEGFANMIQSTERMMTTFFPPKISLLQKIRN